MQAEPQVLHLHSSAGVYGAEYVLLGLLPALIKTGVRCTLLCLADPAHPVPHLYVRARELGVPVECVPCRGQFDPATINALRKKLRQSRSLLHVHGYKSAFYGWLASLGGNIPVVATIHGATPTSLRLRLYAHIERRLLKRFQKICVVSSAMRSTMESEGIPPERLALVENGIDVERFRPDVEPFSRLGLGIPRDAFLFGAAMRLSEEKNPLGLIDAFAAVSKQAPAAWLTIAGDGPLRAQILERAERLGVAAQLRLLGARDDLERYYPMLDCFVLPSHYEGLPLALLEAMAAARPLVCTRVGQIPEVLANLDAAQVAPGDTAALASAMQATILKCERTRPDFRKRVCEKYSAAIMATAYGRVYDTLWRNHGYAIA